jgi:tetratricopeptide (TPR) repeat protein
MKTSFIEEDYSDDDDQEDVVLDSIQSALGGTSMPAKSKALMTMLGYEASKDRVIKKKETSTPFDPLLEQSLGGKRKRRPGVRGRPKLEDLGFGRSNTHKFPPEASQLMGKANAAFVGKRYDEAVSALLEVVRLAPDCFEPYHTLGMVFEEMGQMDKSLGYFMLAAHLNPRNLDLWKRIAEMAITLGRLNEAVYCLGKVIKMGDVDELAFDVFEKRGRLLLDLNKVQAAVKSYCPFLNSRIPPRIEAFKHVASTALKYDAVDIAASVFEQSIFRLRQKSCPWRKLWSPINLLLELLLLRSEYEHLVDYVRDLSQKSSQQQENYSHLPEEIFAKFLVAKIMTRQDWLPDDLQRVTRLDPEAFGDLQLQVADALFHSQSYSSALNLFLTILPQQAIPKESASVLYKVGMCYQQLQIWDHAKEALEEAVTRDPTFDESRTALVDVLQHFGLHEQARHVLQEGYSLRKLKVQSSFHDEASSCAGSLLMENLYDGIITLDSERAVSSRSSSKRRFKKSQILFAPDECKANQELHKRFLLLMNELFGSSPNEDFMEPKLDVNIEPKALKNLLRDATQAASQLWDCVQLIPNIFPPPQTRFRSTSDKSLLGGLSNSEWADFLLNQSRLLFAMGRLDAALKSLRAILSSNLIRDHGNDGLSVQTRQMILLTLMRQGNYRGVAEELRFVWTDYRQDLNRHFYTLTCPDPFVGLNAWSDINFFRAVNRAANKHPELTELSCFAGHLFMLSGSHKDAIPCYRRALEKASKHACGDIAAMIDLFLANSMLQRCLQRTCLHPKQTLVEGMAHLLRYHRHFSQVPNTSRQVEANYNAGRAYHALSLFGTARMFYEQALQLDPEYSPAIHNLQLMSSLHL